MRLSQITLMAKTDQQRWFLKEWRKFRGYNQERMAEMMEMALGYYNEVERGKRRYNQDILEKAAEMLRCDPADLITRDPSAPEAIWSIWEQLQPTQRAQLVEIGQTLKKAG